MKLQNVVPWGRSFKEYREMFSLSDGELENFKILGCGDGPACFNAELTKAGGRAVSVDPLYKFSGEEIRSRIEEVYPQIMSQAEQNSENYIWGNISDVNELGKVRMAAMNKFLDDYQAGKKTGRYINASLPDLPFQEMEFDLALCSHYLFLYSTQVNLNQHILAMQELCRVANEVRVYPLLSLDGIESEHLSPVMSALSEKGIEVSLKSVRYQFQKDATEMLVAKTA